MEPSRSAEAPTGDMFKKADQWVIQPAKLAYTRLSEQWLSFGRQFDAWSEEKLGKPWAKVAQKIVHSSPIAATLFLLPFSLKIVGGIACYGVDLTYGPFSKPTYDTFFAGVTVGCIAIALYNVVSLAATYNPQYALAAIVYGAASYLLFPRANMMEAPPEAAK